MKAYLTPKEKVNGTEVDWESETESVDLEAPVLNDGTTWADEVITANTSPTWAEPVAAQESSFVNSRNASIQSGCFISERTWNWEVNICQGCQGW